jgi:beta-glucosidase
MRKLHYSKEEGMRRNVSYVLFTATIFAAYIIVSAQSGDFTVGGRVVSGGQPVPNATITHMSIAKRLSWDFSKADGTFGGYNGQAVKPFHQAVTITLRSAGPVSIEIFDASGKMVSSEYNAKIDQGTYSLEPVTSRLSKAVYLLKIKAGNQVICRKLINSGKGRIGTLDGQLSSNSPVVLKKTSAVIDSIRVGKTGYTPAYVPISTYADTVGDVTITPVDIEAKVNQIFGTMSQAEIIGQLAMPVTPITANSVSGSNCGSVFGGGGALQGLNASAAADMIDGFQRAMANTTKKIPILAAYDFVHGASALPGAVIFPHNLGMGAIQDSVLIQKAFRVTAFEVRGAGCNWGFGPCIAVIRDDRWGRAYEGFAETPELTQKMARHAVLGIQTTDLSLPTAYAACVKHFAGDGGTSNGVDRGQTTGPDNTARAIHLPGYATAVSTGVATVMPSFSSWSDGTPMHANKTLMTGWLKSTTAGNPGFQGFIVGDWEAHGNLSVSCDAGLDVPMAPSAGTGIINTFNGLYGTLKNRIDDACKRVLRVKAWMGMLNNPAGSYLTDRRLTNLVGCAEHRAVARECVRASMVLLKNANNALPIPKTANVSLWGKGGDDVGIQGGGWVVSWQGGAGTPTPGGTTIKQGCQALCTGTFTYSDNASAGANADYIVAVLSEDPYAEVSFGDISLTNNTPNGGVGPKQNDATTTNSSVMSAIQTAHNAGKKVIVVLIAGRPMNVSTVVPNCDAFVWACLPGTEGNGVADVLFGDYKFSGKLPVTWPNTINDEPINQGDDKTGLFAYGAGLTD